MIEISSKGDFKNITKFLNHVSNGKYIQSVLNKYGELGVKALADATPKDSGKTAESWYYKTFVDPDHAKLAFYNSNSSHGIPVVTLIFYGHATKGGGYVAPRDFINPTIRPIFDKLAEDVWKEVTES